MYYLSAYQKCILLFSRDKSRILIITDKGNYKKESACKLGARTVDFVSLRSEFKGKTLCDLFDAFSRKNAGHHNCKLYDLIILDQVCDSPILHKNCALIWRNRQEMFTSLSKHIEPKGSLVILTQNAINLQKISSLFNALINFFIRTRLPGTFLHQFTNELKNVGFLKFNYFYIYPDFSSFAHLISNDRNAFRDAISHKYSTSLNIYHRPKFWLRWIFTRAQLDRWFLCCQMIWVKK